MEKRLQILRQIGEAAKRAGLEGEIDDDGVSWATRFEFEGGRSQTVCVNPTGELDGRAIVTIWSPVLAVKKGLLGGVSKDKAIELLRRNENVPFARFGLRESDSEFVVVASIDRILETLDHDELKLATEWVAAAADTAEKDFGGGDVF